MAGETVTIESPATEKAEAAAAAATLAAGTAIQEAAHLSAEAERAAAARVETVAEKTAEELQRQEGSLSWLKDHAQQSDARQNETLEVVKAQQQEISTLKMGLTQLGEGMTSLLSLLIPKKPEVEEPPKETPPLVPREGEAEPPEAKTVQRRRRLI